MGGSEGGEEKMSPVIHFLASIYTAGERLNGDKEYLLTWSRVQTGHFSAGHLFSSSVLALLVVHAKTLCTRNEKHPTSISMFW